MSDTQNKFYLTTPIYYVNARPHIGHAYTTIAADVIARRHRLLGDDTYFLTGTDEHGQKIQRSAEAAGIPPQQFADEVSASFQDLWKRMGITNDAFIRTTDAHHKRGAQKLFTQLQQNGFIKLRSYTGQYCISDETFVDVPVGAPCPECGRLTETVTEENYFFKLSKFQSQLIDLIESEDPENPLRIQPDSRKNEVLSFLRGNINQATEPGAPRPASGTWEEAPPTPSETTSPGTPRPAPGTWEEAPPTPSETTKPGAPRPAPGTWEEAPPTPSETTKPGAPRPAPGTWEEAPPTPTEITIAYSAKGIPYQKGALKDLSISRTSVKWGIPVPGDEKHVIYVWLDALSNYMTAIGYGSEDPAEQAKFKKYWPADLHLVGKEIIRFHCVYWPAFLLALNPVLAGKAPDDLPFEEHLNWAKDWVPKAITAHGWLLFEESKMSKSRGNIIRTETILDAFGTLLPKPTEPAGTLGGSRGLQPPESTSEEKGASAPDLPSTEANSTINGTASAVPGAPRPAPGTWEEAPPTSASLGAPSAVPQEPAANTTSAVPQTSVSLKGTASAVPQQSPEGAALAAEVRLPSPSERAWKQEQDLFASDVLRYFLLREIRFGQDGSFSFDALVQRYNSDLANGYGNLVSRTLKMIADFRGASVPIPPQLHRKNSIADDIGEVTLAVNRFLEKQDFFSAIELASGLISQADIELSSKAPWKLAKNIDEESQRQVDQVLYEAAETIRIATGLLYPILPYATARVWRQLGFRESIEEAARKNLLSNLQWGGLRPGTKLGERGTLFPSIKKEDIKGFIQIMNDIEQNNAAQKPAKNAGLPLINNNNDASPHHRTEFAESPISSASATAALNPIAETVHPITPHHPEADPRPETPQIAIDDFIKIDLRVARILLAERIPKADKLLRLEVDLGYEKRQILSGIAQWYTPEELIGRRIVVIANLAPRKMRGLESHGMLLAASHGEDGKPILATFAEDIALGSRLK